MKLDRTLLLVACALLVGWGVAASNDAVKIGFVDVEQVLATTDGGKAVRDELERKGRDAQARLQPLVEEMERIQKDFQSKKLVMSEEAAREMQLDMAKAQNKYENKAKEEEVQFKIDQQRLLGPLIEKLDKVISEVGKENGYSVILRIDAPSLVYAREALDVTDLVIKTFNRKG